MHTRKIFAVMLLLLLAAAQATAQSRKQSADDTSQYVVSAKSGIISVISGDVSLRRGNDWEPLLEGDELKAGDVVKTSAHGRAEILLNPGTYLRLGENTEFAFPELVSFRLKLSLLSGSAILEASAIDVAIKFTTPQQMFTIAKNGLYRFHAEANGKSEMLVYKGKVKVGNTEVKDGKKVVVDNAAPAVLAFNKKDMDEFDTWSKDRAKAILAANKQLSNRLLRSSMAYGLSSNLWVFDPWLRSYTFLPGWRGFSSPYGGGYSNCNPFWANQNPYRYGNNNNGGWGNGGNNGNGGYAGGGNSGGGNSSGGNSGGGVRGGGFGGGNPGGSVSNPGSPSDAPRGPIGPVNNSAPGRTRNDSL